MKKRLVIDNYPSMNEDNDTPKSKAVWEIENKFANVNINDADFVVTNHGTLINMNDVKKILAATMKELVQNIDKDLAYYFASMRINYTFKLNTFAVDGKILYINPEFILNLYNMPEPYGDIQMVAYVLLHECFHLLYDHCNDKKGIEISNKSERDKDLVNMAMDYQINWVIEHSTFAPDPDSGLTDYPFLGYTKMCDGCIDDRFKYMDWPEIYSILKKEDADTSNKGMQIEKSKPEPKKMSDEWYDGLMQGLNDKINQLRSDKLIESLCKIYV